MEKPVLNTGLLREAMAGSARRSRLEEAEATARFNAEKTRIESEFRKKFKIASLEKTVHDIKRALDNAEHDLEVAKQQMHEAMAEKIAELQEKNADSLALITAGNASREFKLLALSLPEEAARILELDKITVKPETARLLTAKEN
jgi:septal ring factor EnvC (AmiA/AmiB activator)